METKKIAETLITLCRDGRYFDAIGAFYSDDIVSVGSNGGAAEMRGIDVVRAKYFRWLEDHDIHATKTEAPLVNGESFSVVYEFDMTPKRGEHAGQRTRMRETAVYTTRHGKIVREEFFH